MKDKWGREDIDDGNELKENQNKDILKKIEEVLEVLDEKCSREDAESRGMEKEWDGVQKLKEVKEIFKKELKNEKS